MTKEEIIDKAFYQLDDLDESYKEVLEDMYDHVVAKACEWFRHENAHAVPEWLDHECEKLRETMNS